MARLEALFQTGFVLNFDQIVRVFLLCHAWHITRCAGHCTLGDVRWTNRKSRQQVSTLKIPSRMGTSLESAVLSCGGQWPSRLLARGNAL
jgi:hypothetical protein